MKLTADETIAVDAILLDWERERIARLAALRQAELRSAELKAQATDIFRRLPGSSLSPQDVEALTNRSRSIQAEAAKHDLPPSKRLVELNRATLIRIKDVLPEAKARVVEMQYFEEAYPEVYPDAAWAGELYDLAEAMDDLTNDQRALLAGLRAAFQQQHDRLSERMMESVVERGEAQMARGPNYTIPVYAAWDRQMALGLEREALNQAQRAKIASVLLPEQAARLPEWDFEKNPPARPWLRRGSK